MSRTDADLERSTRGTRVPTRVWRGLGRLLARLNGSPSEHEIDFSTEAELECAVFG